MVLGTILPAIIFGLLLMDLPFDFHVVFPEDSQGPLKMRIESAVTYYENHLHQPPQLRVITPAIILSLCIVLLRKIVKYKDIIDIVSFGLFAISVGLYGFIVIPNGHALTTSKDHLPLLKETGITHFVLLPLVALTVLLQQFSLDKHGSKSAQKTTKKAAS